MMLYFACAVFRKSLPSIPRHMFGVHIADTFRVWCTQHESKYNFTKNVHIIKYQRARFSIFKYKLSEVIDLICFKLQAYRIPKREDLTVLEQFNNVDI